jgi:hypothetical protein
MDNGMIFFPFHSEMMSREVEVIVLPKENKSAQAKTKTPVASSRKKRDLEKLMNWAKKLDNDAKLSDDTPISMQEIVDEVNLVRKMRYEKNHF